MANARPMLDDLELQLVQKIETDGDQVFMQHSVPALEGDFLQGLQRRARQITLTGVLTGPEVGEGLKALRDKFRAAEPVPFVADITTATRVDQVLIEEMGVRELAGKPERFEYAFTLREYIPASEVITEEPPEPEPPERPDEDTGTLIVEVIVEGQPNFDHSQTTVTVEGTQEDGTSLSRTLTNRTAENVWEEEKFPPGTYTVKAVVTDPQSMSGSAEAVVQAGQTEQVTIVLRLGQIIAKAFVVHFWFDKAFIEPCMCVVLRQVAEYAQAHSDEKLVIVGHTDKVGDNPPVEPLYNQSLSERRARSVFAYLTFGRDRAGALSEWDQLRRRRTPGVRRSLNDTWDTREYQYMLQDLGYYPGNVDGDHGPLTDTAVRTFQGDKGLTVDGIVGDTTWAALNDAYLSRQALAVPESQFLPNCDGEILKWLGCGEQDPVKNTEDAWRPNRRTELLFVKADALPCKIPEPDTFDLPTSGAVGGGWCLGPGKTSSRCCFLTRDTAAQDKWLVQPAEPGTITVQGSILFEDGTPLANTKYVLIAPDGEFMDGERPRGPDRGRPIPGRTDANGKFDYSAKPKGVGIYTIEVELPAGPHAAFAEGDPPATARGSVVCKRLDTSNSTFNVIVHRGPAGSLAVNPTITLASPVVVVKKPYTNPARQLVTLGSDAPFTGSGTFTRSSATIRFFNAAVGGTEITFDGTDNIFTGPQLSAGVQLFAEGATASAALNDVQLTLTLSSAALLVGPPVTTTMTAVELTLDICQSRTAAGVDPTPLPAAPPAIEKINVGRFVHIQDPGNHHGRAMLIVRQAQPAAFAGDLVLRPINASVRAFGAADEVAAPGQVPLANPHSIPNGTIAAGGERFWAEGVTVSGALRDTGFQLGIKDLENDGDRVAMTVVRLSNLQADIPSTPAHTPRLGNSPVARHTFTRGAGAALNAADFDEDFTANAPLVLLEGSVLAAHPINMSVQVAPAGVPISWKSVQRDTRPAPDGDHASIIALSPNPIPTLTPDAGNQLQATLLTDAVGSFHIRPFVDCNGNGQFDHNIDREPFIIMNLVLVRVTLNQDNSLPHNNFNVAQATTPAGAPIAGSIFVSSGAFNIANPATAAIHMNAQADVVGGGDDGTRGLDRVFAGWVNNESANEDIIGTFRDTSVAPAVNRLSTSVFASNAAAATGAGLTGRAFIPGNPAPALEPPPLLDTGRGNPGSGGDTACLTRSRIRTRTNLRTPLAPAAVGQRFLVEAVDSPGDGDGPNHPGFPAAQLVRFRFGLDFSAFLCFWTNITAVSGATGDPADRLYSALRQINWRMRGEWTVNPATGAIAQVTAPSVQITGSTTFNPLAAAVSVPVEVRPPTGLSLLARDARA